MGIVGLKRYIENRKADFYESFDLHHQLVIIDGWSLCTVLYFQTYCFNICGGDYNRYANYIYKFFNDLLQCEVTPLVILSGGWINKKKQSKIDDAIKHVENHVDRNAGKNIEQYFPLLGKDIFVDVMKKMGIQYCMCISEAIDNIPSISKILSVPVMSINPDFFIHEVDYIPLNTLHPNIVKCEKGYNVMRCCIYRTKKLLEQFQGLDITVLPLALILLGDDYITKDTFSDFFSPEELKGMKNEDEQQCRIETVFQWLKYHSLNSAVTTILSRLPKENRKRILQSIEKIVDGYFRLTTYMLRPLGIEEKTDLNIQKNFKPFKFDANNGNSEDIDGTMNNMKLHENQDEENNEEKFLSSVPQWFIDDLLAGKLPSCFVNILIHRIFLVPVKIEDDLNKCSAMKISFPIITKIFSLLTTTRENIANNVTTVIQLFVREGIALNSYNLSVPLSPVAFDDIRNLSVIERKKIIDDTLNIHTNDNLDELPFSWQLYVAAILFWMRQDDDTDRPKFQLDALLVSMLIGIIDRNIGFQRLPTSNWRQSSDSMNEKMRFEEIIGNDKSIIMIKLISSITKNDCVTGKEFFMPHTKPRTLSQHCASQIEIHHPCTQFQACLLNAMNLNALLGNIYVTPSVTEFLNCTIYCSICIDFSTKSNVHEYIATKLGKSNGLMKVFTAMSKKISECLQNM